MALAGFVAVGDPFVLATSSGEEVAHLKVGEQLGKVSSVIIVPWAEEGAEVGVMAAAVPEEEASNLNLNKDLSHEKTAVQELLDRHRGVFSYSDEDIGQLGLTKHRIRVTG